MHMAARKVEIDTTQWDNSERAPVVGQCLGGRGPLKTRRQLECICDSIQIQGGPTRYVLQVPAWRLEGRGSP
jgi:hypothetical protein